MKQIAYNEYGEPIVRTRSARAARFVAIVVVLLVNLFLILRTLAACDAEITQKTLYSAILQKNLASASLSLPAPQGFSSFLSRRKNASGARVYKLENENKIEDDAHMQIKNVLYLDGADNLQFTMKQNTRHYPLYNDTGALTLSYLVRVIDRDGNETYADTKKMKVKSEERYGYAYTRVSFDDLPITLGTDYVTLYVFLTDQTDATVLTLTLSSQTTVSNPKELKSLDFVRV